jgi:hypothetical protein
MTKYFLPILLFIATALFVACSQKSRPEDPAVWNKVKIDFNRLDENGLAGPPDGKVAVNYEFCIPADDKNWNEVKKIDGTAQVQKGSKGRVGCTENQWLVIGSTHQKNYRRVIYDLASLSYVQQIQETFFE